MRDGKTDRSESEEDTERGESEWEDADSEAAALLRGNRRGRKAKREAREAQEEGIDQSGWLDQPLALLLDLSWQELPDNRKRFAELILDGLTPLEAYDRVYNDKSEIRTKRSLAKKLAADPEVRRYIRAVVARRGHPAYGQEALTKDQWLTSLKSLAEEARRTGRYSAAVSALELYAKGQGWLKTEADEGDTIEVFLWRLWIERGKHTLAEAPGHVKQVLGKGVALALLPSAPIDQLDTQPLQDAEEPHSE